jgi:hypothetical protein
VHQQWSRDAEDAEKNTAVSRKELRRVEERRKSGWIPPSFGSFRGKLVSFLVYLF